MTPTKRLGRPPTPGPRNLRVYRVRGRKHAMGPIVYEDPTEWVVPDIKGAILDVMLLSKFKKLAKWNRRHDEVMHVDCQGLTEKELRDTAQILGMSIAIKAPLPG